MSRDGEYRLADANGPPSPLKPKAPKDCKRNRPTPRPHRRGRATAAIDRPAPAGAGDAARHRCDLGRRIHGQTRADHRRNMKRLSLRNLANGKDAVRQRIKDRTGLYSPQS